MNTEVRPFRFAIFAKGAATRAAWLDLLDRVDGGGFGALHFPMHAAPQFAPFVAFADAAARTSLTFATLVHNNDLQHPALLARDAMTLSVLSEGRVEMGIGAGWKDRDYLQLGIPMDPGRVRAARLAEAIEILRRSWAGETFSFHGEHYTVQDLQGLSGPQVPLLIGAGRDGLLRLAARSADIVSFTRRIEGGSTARDIAEDPSLERKAATLREYLGDRAADVELQIMVVRAGTGTEASRQLDEYVSASGMSEGIARQTAENLLGRDPQELADMLQERRARTGISYYTFRYEHLDLVRPVVERLTGT